MNIKCDFLRNSHGLEKFSCLGLDFAKTTFENDETVYLQIYKNAIQCIKTILVPHGGTSAGDESLRHAIHLAKSSTAKIILIHVIEDIPIPPSFALSQSERDKLAEDIGNANKAMRESMEKNFIEKSSEYKNSGIEIEHNVVSGDAAEEILKIIQEKKYRSCSYDKTQKTQRIEKNCLV